MSNSFLFSLVDDAMQSPEDIRYGYERLLQKRYADLTSADNIKDWPMARYKAWSEALKEAWEAFYQAHVNIVNSTVDPDEIVRNNQIQELNEEYYLEAKELLSQYISMRDVAGASTLTKTPSIFNDAVNTRQYATGSGTFGNQQPIVVHVAREVVPPKFDGNHTNWLAFKGAFILDVDQRDNLSEFEKLKALIESCREGTARQALGTWTYESGNYRKAWDWLCSTYDDRRKVIELNLRTLCELPHVGYSDVSALQSLISKASNAIRSLTDLKEPVHEWDTFLVFMIEKKLDNKLKEKWESVRNDRPRVHVDELIQYLNSVRRRLIQSDFNNDNKVDLRVQIDKGRHEEPRRSFGQSDQKYPRQQPSNSERKPRLQSAITKPRIIVMNPSECSMCKGRHKISECQAWKALPIHERARRVMLAGLCRNCLKLGHRYRECPTGPCRRCDKNEKHHNMLCTVHDMKLKANQPPPAALPLQ